jgi:hypothetical protein
MKIASGWGKDHHVPMVGILLIVAALVVGIAACDGADTYQLTISGASGGSIATPGEGTFNYDAGTVVQLVAMPDDGYQFRSWTGDIAYIEDPDAASTAITMNDNYAIVANFEAEDGTAPSNGGNGGPTQP